MWPSMNSEVILHSFSNLRLHNLSIYTYQNAYVMKYFISGLNFLRFSKIIINLTQKWRIRIPGLN